jgi:uncharacterized coiled-coil protein SlyX
MSNFTVPNPANAAESYTFGTKGRKPTWVTAGLADGSIKVPEGYKSTKEKLAEAAASKPAKAPKAEKSAEKRIAKLNVKLAHAVNKLEVAKKHLATAQADVDGFQAEIDSLKTPVAETEEVTETAVVTDDAPMVAAASG